jgi:hypothetical protein
MINQVTPLLRTDLIRDMFKRIQTLKHLYNINWYGQLDQVLFPIDPRYYDMSSYSAMLMQAGSMKDLYEIIKQETEEMFLILSKEYTFYCPSKHNRG